MARNIQQIGEVVQSGFHRKSEQRNRLPLEVVVSRTSASVTPIIHYTVTPGSKAYITAIHITYGNDINVVGELHLRDSGSSKLPLLADAKDIGTNVSFVSTSLVLEGEPMVFATNIETIAISGSVEFSLTLIGYEEKI